MVGRFQSDELKRDALAHEDLYMHHGLLGRCAGLLGLALAVVGLLSLISPFLSSEVRWSGRNTGATNSSSPATPISSLQREYTVLENDVSSSFSSGQFSGDFADYRTAGVVTMTEPKEEARQLRMGVDFSLLAVIATLLALCVLPQCLRASSSSSSSSFATTPWAASPVPGASPWQGYATPGSASASARPGFFGCGELGWGGTQQRRPADMQGASGFQGFGGPWANPAGFGNPGFGPGSLGGTMDWTYGQAMPGVNNSSSAAWGASPYGGSVPSGPGFLQGQRGYPGAPGVGAFGQVGLPNEAEVQETYASFGAELQQWAESLASFVDQQVIAPMLVMLDTSDREWQQALAERGWRLTTEQPRSSYPGVGLAMGASGIQEISIFERNLPKPWCDDPMCVEKWKQRQTMEDFLAPPAFGPPSNVIRQYVLDRLREWRQRGIARAIRHDWRQSENMPTDAHIIENLVMRTVHMHFPEFSSCFLSHGHAPPQGRHLGQEPAAYLRQVVDQTMPIKSAPHYDVVALHRVWRLRPGSSNVLEALALLMQFLRRHSSSYQAAFPPALTAAFESPSSSSFLQPLRSIYNAFF